MLPVHAGMFLMLLPFAVGGKLVNLPSLLRWSDGGSISLTAAMAEGLVNLRPQGGLIFIRFALAGGWGGRLTLLKRAAQSASRV